jgi:hypothetical protein
MNPSIINNLMNKFLLIIVIIAFCNLHSSFAAVKIEEKVTHTSASVKTTHLRASVPNVFSQTETFHFQNGSIKGNITTIIVVESNLNVTNATIIPPAVNITHHLGTVSIKSTTPTKKIMTTHKKTTITERIG